MRSLLFVVISFLVTILAWGVYGPVLHWGQHDMSSIIGQYARLRPFVCVGLAYFAIGVVVPTVLLQLRGEPGDWTFTGILYSLAGGALGAIGALGIIMAFNFGGKPVYVMPLVFGGAPVVNSFLTIYLAGKMKEIGPIFTAGLVMVLIGAVTVLIFNPSAKNKAAEEPNVVSEETAAGTEIQRVVEPQTYTMRDFVLRFASIACVVVCWGAYGPVLHKGQAAMHHSRYRAFICVGIAYFAIAVLVPNLILAATGEASQYNFSGTMWSLAAGAAGAIGALGIIMAFNFGGKPVYVMPLVFGGAPVINTLFTTVIGDLWEHVGAFFLAGLILVIAGSGMVLVFAPRGGPRPLSNSDAPSQPQPAPSPTPPEVRTDS